MSKLFPEPMFYAVVDEEGAMLFAESRPLVFEEIEDANNYILNKWGTDTTAQIQGVYIAEAKDF